MATKRAYVYETSNLLDPYKVFPPVVILKKGDKLEFVNTVTTHDAFLTVPDGVFQGGAVKKQKVGKKSTFSTNDANEGPLGVEYEVEVDGKKATAHSDPVIIIDPA
jgi:hypothetical protein